MAKYRGHVEILEEIREGIHEKVHKELLEEILEESAVTFCIILTKHSS